MTIEDFHIRYLTGHLTLREVVLILPRLLDLAVDAKDLVEACKPIMGGENDGYWLALRESIAGVEEEIP